jgi:radical SAM superfamily enzyme YgiQ (UPF0313 family)
MPRAPLKASPEGRSPIMRVLLINPPTRRRPSPIGPIIRTLFYNSPPLGLAYLAAVLEQDGHEVTIVDCLVRDTSLAELAARAKALAPELIGITSTTPYYHAARETAAALHAVAPGASIGLGGAHVTANPELLLTDDCFSFGVRGEGELTLREIAACLAAGNDYRDVPGVVTVDQGSLRFAPPREYIENLDALPPPARRLLPIRDYRPLPNDQHRLPKTSMISSRGCPYGCVFCDKQVFGSRYRSHSPQRIVAEMHALEREFGVRDIAFVDSTFTPNRARVEAVLDAMEADPPRATWTCTGRANVLEEDLLRRMRRMNCWRIRVGVESGNEQILRDIRKGVTRQEVERTTRAADRLGLQVKVFFMIGHLGETRATIEESIRFARELPAKDVTVQINTPLRGTPQYEPSRTRGRMLTTDSSDFSFFQPGFVPEGLTAAELAAAHRRFYRRFYLRPITVWRHLKTIRGPVDVTKYFRALPLVIRLLFGRSDIG